MGNFGGETATSVSYLRNFLQQGKMNILRLPAFGKKELMEYQFDNTQTVSHMTSGSTGIVHNTGILNIDTFQKLFGPVYTATMKEKDKSN